ncbi:hypothetical protein ACWC5I_16645, partial [Kitasatospora sp. NPDC001574]
MMSRPAAVTSGTGWGGGSGAWPVPAAGAVGGGTVARPGQSGCGTGGGVSPNHSGVFEYTGKVG